MRARPLLAAAAAVSVLASCSSGAEVAAGSGGQGCTALMSVLPSDIVNVGGRVEIATPFAAAWSDPAVTLRCGVPTPASLDLESEVITVNGVDWFVEQGTEADTATTYGRVTNVEVRVPKDYHPSPEVLVDMAAPVAASIPVKPED